LEKKSQFAKGARFVKGLRQAATQLATAFVDFRALSQRLETLDALIASPSASAVLQEMREVSQTRSEDLRKALGTLDVWDASRLEVARSSVKAGILRSSLARARTAAGTDLDAAAAVRFEELEKEIESLTNHLDNWQSICSL
jgi:hypothetical protein